MSFDCRKIETSDGEWKFHLILDGKTIESNRCYVSIFRDAPWVAVYDPALFDTCMSANCAELASKFSQFGIDYPHWLDSQLQTFDLDEIRVCRSPEGGHLEVRFDWDFPNWKQPWTIFEHATEFRNRIEDLIPDILDWRDWDEEEILNGFGIELPIQDWAGTVAFNFEPYLGRIEQAQREAVNNLVLRARTGTVGVLFDFPEEVRTACEQYLLYFGQFLRDVGVSASAEIKEHAGSVLFTVTPNDEGQALEKLRVALELYLRLPASPVAMGMGIGLGSIEVQRLVSNIFHLNGQLALANATIQQQNLTIQHQQSLIQQQLLSAQIMVDAMRKGDVEGKELVVGDVVALKKLDWECIEVDLPTLIRRLKRWLGRGGDE